MAHPTYSPKDVNISFSGVALTGFAEDDFLTLSRTSALIEPTVGADGILTRAKVADRTGTIALSVAQTARTNALLSVIAKAQEEAGSDVPIGNFVISDPSGSVLGVGINAVLSEYPEVTLGATAGNAKEWMFHCEILEYGAIPDSVAELLPEFTIVDGQLIQG